MESLIFFGSSTFSSNVYDGGANINFNLLKHLANNKKIGIIAFGTNLSKKVILRRGNICFDKFIIVRKHVDESVGFGILKNLLAVLKNKFFKEIIKDSSIDFILSGSDFWPDSIPAFFAKLRYGKVKWIASFYLFAPKPWQKNSPYRTSLKVWLIGLMYWLTQLPIYWIVKKYADMVFVTSEPDVEKFITKKRGKDRIVVIRGGVDTKPSQEYLKSGDVVPVEKRKCDACFVGRFHYQKGVLELVDIWKLVCKENPDAKLAMIGVGPLEKEVREKIERLGLQNNIEVLGFKDGEEKYEIFKQSKIVVHPATYDSGGMAACEAMAWELPGVSFDLEALKTYYPKGMLKTSCYDLRAFAENILRLLKDEELYQKTKQDALEWSAEWDWDRRAQEILDVVQSLLALEDRV